MTVDLSNATATYQVNDLPIGDHTNFANGVVQVVPPTAATCSFTMTWRGALKSYQNNNPAETFKGDFIQTNGTLQWSASQEGFQFVSDPAATSDNDIAIIGMEQNGIYFSN